MIWVAILTTVVRAKDLPVWHYFCRNHDVVIVKGELGDEQLSDKVDVDVFQRSDEDYRLLAAVHRLTITSVVSAPDSFPSYRLQKSKQFNLDVVVDYARWKEKDVELKRLRKGYFVLMWTPFLSDPVYKVVAHFGEKDLQAVLAARSAWCKDRLQGVEEE